MASFIRAGRGCRSALLAASALLLLHSPETIGAETRQNWVREELSGIRIPFIANAGQADPAVAYYASTFVGTVFVTRDGRIVYSLPREGLGSRPGEKASGLGIFPSSGKTGWSLTETVVGGKARLSSGNPTSTGVSYFIGDNPSRWRTGVRTFDGVSLGEVWPGVSLDLRAHGSKVEKLFTVKPGADPSRIRIRVDGGQSLRVNTEGALVVEIGQGQVSFSPPLAFQKWQGIERPVRVAYELRGKEYGFRLSGHDPGLPVVIDPLLQATYLGGSGRDLARALAIHPTSGDVYVAGGTSSGHFPGTTGGAQPANGGAFNVFIARLNSSLTTLIQATYLGGSGIDAAHALAVDPTSGDVYVAGDTKSLHFPGTTGGAQAAHAADNGSSDGFVARLNSSLTALAQATYLGGDRDDEIHGLGIHPTSGDVYIAGYSKSTHLRGTGGGAQETRRGVSDAFVARLNSSLTALVQTTYLGGSSDEDLVSALAIHPTSGDVYVAGSTASMDFPGTAGGAQAAHGADGGVGDLFIARLNSSLTVLTQATYLGGGDVDILNGLAIHPASGDVYVAGDTLSADFPGTAGGAQAAHGAGSGAPDAFIARLNSSLTTLIQATYLGGGGADTGKALAIHPTSGDVYVAGATESTDFPGTTGGVQAVHGVDTDAFVARLNSSLTTLIQTTYLGGSGSDAALAIAVHPTSGDVYVAGNTTSADFPGTVGGAQPAHPLAHGEDAFIACLTADLLFTSASALPSTGTTVTSDTPCTGLAAQADRPAAHIWMKPLERSFHVRTPATNCSDTPDPE